MSTKWAGKSTLTKAATILAIIFLVSAGLCGANFVAVISVKSVTPAFLMITAYAELAGMIIGLVGLLAVAVIGIVGAIIRHLSSSADPKAGE